MNNIFVLSKILPIDVLSIINNIVKKYYITKIIKYCKNYILYKKFLINQLNLLPMHNNFFYITFNTTVFYFNNLTKLLNVNDYLNTQIPLLYIKLEHSIVDYEWIGNSNNNNYLQLKNILFDEDKFYLLMWP